MNRLAGYLGASLVAACIAVVAAGCSRSDIDLGASPGDDSGSVSDVMVPEGSPGPKCGNGTCDPNENCSNCALDCGVCPSCGNGKCDENETCSSCPQDCGQCASCGDGKCEKPQENCQTCAPDCGVCPGCGDGVCTAPNETCFTCPSDCGKCMGCGDGVCSGNETCASCEADCGPCSVCGNGKCEPPYETCINCPTDCGTCVTKDCLQSVTCLIGCIGGLGGGGGGLRDGGVGNVLLCTTNCVSEACPKAQYFVSSLADCFIGAILSGTCGMGVNINCLMQQCQSQVTACLDSHC